MSNRWDWYYEHLVLENELDNSFGALETSDWQMMFDTGLCRDPANEAEYGGIFWGWDATHTTGLNISITDGAAYDDSGHRVCTGASLTVTPTSTGTTAIGQGGVPTGGVDTKPAVGKERWVTIFAVYDRLLSDQRYDGYDNLVYFSRAESFHFYVSMGIEKTIGSLLVADKPVREDGKLLITDVQIKNVTGSSVYIGHDQDRKEVFFRVTCSATPHKTIVALTTREAIEDLLTMYNAHASGGSDQHTAVNILYPSTAVWADGHGGNVGGATTVKAGLDGIVADLSKKTTVGGTSCIGSIAQTGTLQTPTQAAPLSFTSTTLQAQLTAIMNAVNGRVFRGGDNSIAGVLSPAVNGTAFGTASLSWDALLRDITVKGGVKSNLVPTVGNTYDLGADAARWDFVFASAFRGATVIVSGVVESASVETPYVDAGLVEADALTVGTGVDMGVNSHLVPLETATFDLGASGRVWREIFVGSVHVTDINATSISTTGSITAGTYVEATTDLKGASAILTNDLTVGRYVKSDLVPNANVAYSIGSPSLRWDTLFANVLNINGITAQTVDAYVSVAAVAVNCHDATLTGDLTVGESVKSNLIPITHDTYDLGSDTMHWQDIFTGTIKGTTATFSDVITGGALVATAYGNIPRLYGTTVEPATDTDILILDPTYVNHSSVRRLHLDRYQRYESGISTGQNGCCTDSFGLVSNPRGVYESDWLCSSASPLSNAEINVVCRPFYVETRTAPFSLYSNSGYNHTEVTAVDMMTGDKYLNMATAANMLASDLPAFMFSFYCNHSLGSFNDHALVQFGFKTHVGEPQRRLMLTLTGVGNKEIVGEYWEDGGLWTRDILNSDSPVLDTLYVCRVVMLARNKFFYDVRGNGALVGQATRDATSSFPAAATVQPFITISSVNSGPVLGIHKVSISSCATAQLVSP